MFETDTSVTVFDFINPERPNPTLTTILGFAQVLCDHSSGAKEALNTCVMHFKQAAWTLCTRIIFVSSQY